MLISEMHHEFNDCFVLFGDQGCDIFWIEILFIIQPQVCLQISFPHTQRYASRYSVSFGVINRKGRSIIFLSLTVI